MGITRFPHGISSIGVPLHGMSGGVPILGTVYYVDGTNGLDGNTGLEPGEAFKTVQRAITVQSADTTSLGDVIYIMPGTYTETVTTAAFDKCSLIGPGNGSVIMQSATGSAFTIGVDGFDGSGGLATMNNSLISGIIFRTSSTASTKAALLVAIMQYSVIHNCRFQGVTNAQAGVEGTVGLQLGSHTDTDWEFHEFGSITNCVFTHTGGRVNELDTPILIGTRETTNPSYNGFKNMLIADNIIGGEIVGIELWMGASSCGGSVIARNIITSNQGGVGPTLGIASNSDDGDDLLCMVVDNRIAAINDAIIRFSAGNVQGNIVSLNGAAPAWEEAA